MSITPSSSSHHEHSVLASSPSQLDSTTPSAAPQDTSIVLSNHHHDDDDFVVVQSNNTGGAADATFSQLYSASARNSTHQHYKRRLEANFTELQNDEDDAMYEGDGVELINNNTSAISGEQNDDDYNEPTSATTLQSSDQEDKQNSQAEEGEKDQVHDISSIIPPDTFEMCDGKCIMSTNTIWYANLFFIYSFGILLGLVLAKPCDEFYSTELLIPGSSSGAGGGDMMTATTTTTSTTTMAPIISSPPASHSGSENTLHPLSTTTESPTVSFHHNHTVTKKKIQLKDDLSASDCTWALISSCFGFISFFAWVISFVPQLYVNYTRKSIVGQSIAFAYTNFLGFSCYSVFNICLYSFDSIKIEYQERFHTRNDVELNDVLYALFSALCTGINTYQCLFYERGGQKVHRIVPIFIWGSIALMAVWALLIGFFFDANKPSSENPYMMNPLDFLYGIGMLKVIVTAVKYAPQVLLNYKRKKTVGMSISQWIMDFTGGTFSLSQEILDAALRDEWVALEGNFVKLLLSVFTLFYDMGFFIQHYCLYAKNNEKIISEYQRKMRIARLREIAGADEDGREYD